MTEQTKPTIKTKKFLDVVREMADRKDWCLTAESLIKLRLGLTAAISNPEYAVKGCDCTLCKAGFLEETKPVRLTYVSGPTELDKDKVAALLVEAMDGGYLLPGEVESLALRFGIWRRVKKLDKV